VNIARERELARALSFVTPDARAVTSTWNLASARPRTRTCRTKAMSIAIIAMLETRPTTSHVKAGPDTRLG
jgi:hypothetical protein